MRSSEPVGNIDVTTHGMGGYAGPILGTVGTVAGLGGMALGAGAWIREWIDRDRRRDDRGYDRGFPGAGYPVAAPYAGFGYGVPAVEKIVVKEGCGCHNSCGCNDNGGHHDHQQTKVNHWELGQAEIISKLQAQLEEVKAEKFAVLQDEKVHGKADKATELALTALTEIKGLRAELVITEKLQAQIASLKDEIVRKDGIAIENKLNGRINVAEAEQRCCCESERAARICGDEKLGIRIHGAEKDARYGLALESERRECGDRNIAEWVRGTYVPGEIYLPQSRVGRVAYPIYPCDQGYNPYAGSNNQASVASHGAVANGAKYIIKDNTLTSTPTTTITNSGDGEVATGTSGTGAT